MTFDDEFNANIEKMQEAMTPAIPEGYDYTLIVGARDESRKMVILGSAGNRDLENSVHMLRLFIEGQKAKEQADNKKGFLQ